MSYEDSFLNRLDRSRKTERRLETPKVPVREPLSEADRSLVASLAGRKDAESLSMDDSFFQEMKNSQQLKRDKAEVERLEKHFRNDDESLLASAFEYAISRRINGPSKWLGAHMSSQLTAPYDDYVNKVDLYLEDTQAEAPRPIGLSMDVTFSRDGKTIEGKLQDLKSKLLDGGRLARLDYHKPLQTETSAGTGPVISLPKVIVGIERKRALDALRTFHADEQTGRESESRDIATGLTLLYQMTEQLRAYLW